MFNKIILKSKKYLYYLFYIFCISIFVLTIKFRYERLNSTTQKQKNNNKEGFINKERFNNKEIINNKERFTNIITKNNYNKSTYPQANFTENLPIIVLKNNTIYSKIKIGVLQKGCISFEICKFIKKYIYPIDVYYHDSYIDLYNSLINNKIDMTIIPDDLLIKSVLKKDKYVNNLLSSKNSNIEVISPLYYETFFFISNNEKINNFEDITNIDKINNKKIKVGVWANSLYYFYIICKNKNIKYKTDSKFEYIIIDDLSNLLNELNNNSIDCAFFICHPKNTILTTSVLYSENNNKIFKLINLYSNNNEIDYSIINDNDNKNLFVNNMKKDIKWLFKYRLNLNRLLTNNNNLVNTFQIRSLLVINENHNLKNKNSKNNIKNNKNNIKNNKNNINSNKNYTKNKHIKNNILKEFINNFIDNYHSLSYFIENWNFNNNLQNSDTESFNFKEIASIPKELKINNIMKNKLQNLNMLKMIKD